MSTNLYVALYNLKHVDRSCTIIHNIRLSKTGNGILSKSPNRLQFENSLFVREETNGTTVHEIESNTHKFFKDIPVDSFAELDTRDEAAALVARLEDEGHRSRDIELTRPFRVNWLGSLACNLACVYCYAEDKMDQGRPTEPQVFDTIEALDPMVVGITGGEPLMSPYLANAIKRFSGNYGLVLDTNGTVRPRPELLEALGEANATVRVTIDSTQQNVLNAVRPSRSGHEYSPEKIFETIRSLGRAGINVLAHTVMTSQNADRLDEVGRKLVGLGIEHWQVYPVEYTHKYRASYPFLRVDSDQVQAARADLTRIFEGDIDIRVYDQKEPTDGSSIIMIENNGDVILDEIADGAEKRIKPGDNLLERVMSNVNTPQHIEDYLY
jgi:MoaA/NifB/PqqE/SkfB family radical SAM enzyme